MLWFLVFVASYIIGVIGWGIIFIIIDDSVETVNDLKEGLLESPAIIPFLNIMLLMGFIPFSIIFSMVVFIYKHCGIEKWWNKTKCKKLPFRE